MLSVVEAHKKVLDDRYTVAKKSKPPTPAPTSAQANKQKAAYSETSSDDEDSQVVEVPRKRIRRASYDNNAQGVVIKYLFIAFDNTK